MASYIKTYIGIMSENKRNGGTFVNGLLKTEEIFNSWKRCMKAGLPSAVSSPSRQLRPEELQSVLEENRHLVRAFEESMEGLDGLITGHNLVYFLTEASGILLKKRAKTQRSLQLSQKGCPWQKKAAEPMRLH